MQINTEILRPQKGKQEMFLASSADIAIYGGAAGGGKTYASLLEPLRHIQNPLFAAEFFRRTTSDIRKTGGLWDESQKIYPLLGAISRSTFLDWRFPVGSKIKLSGLQYDSTCQDYKGAQIPLALFDEVDSFSEFQFFYMMSRNRSACGIQPYMRATCNPNSESWLRKFLDWWIDNDTGLAIEERAGVIRYFIRVNEQIFWADTKQELLDKYGQENLPKSVAFIPAKLSDNPILEQVDPNYRANLMAQSMVERERLLNGNWNISAAGGLCKIEWFKRYNSNEPIVYKEYYQSWDTALKDGEQNDYSVCTTFGITPNDLIHIVRVDILKLQFPQLKQKIAELAGVYKPQAILIEDKASGITLLQTLKQELGNYNFIPINPVGDKVLRFSKATLPIEAGRLYLPTQASWLNDFELQIKAFPKSANDDIVDTVSQFLNWYELRPQYNIRSF